MTLWCVQIAGALCKDRGGKGVMWQILFSDDCYNISCPACSSIAFPHPQYQIELNLHPLPSTSLNMGRPVTNIKGWEWHSAFCDRSQKGNTALHCEVGHSPLESWAIQEDTQVAMLWGSLDYLKKPLVGILADSPRWDPSQQTYDIITDINHWTYEWTASKWFQSSVIKSFLHLSLPSWGPRHHVERWLPLLCPEFLTQPMVVLCH